MEFINKIIIHASSFSRKNIYKIVSVFEGLYLRLIGVIYEGRGVFRGWCSVYRKPGSTIIIGHDCTFNSAHYANHVGLNHRCIVCTMNQKASLTIGNNVGVSSSSITAFDEITIEDDVRIGANCVIMDGDFHLDDPRTSSAKPILIKKNVWLGYGVIVMKGVTIGENSVIGANSIVTKDIPANVVAAGSPCKVIKSLK